MQLVKTVIDLSTFPEFPAELNSTDMRPDSPGAMGCCGQFLAVVQPHDGLTWAIINGAFPVLVN
jgi:hypothetical protein